MKMVGENSSSVSSKMQVTDILRIDTHYEKLRKSEDVRNFYSDRTQCEEIVEVISKIATKKKIKVISYDVFDTALLRQCKSEARRFLEISERFVAHCEDERKSVEFKAEDVFIARVTASRAAYSISRSIAGNKEGKLDDIAQTTCELLGYPELADDFVRNELAYELEVLSPNPLLALIAEALPQTRIIFVSDMYLESDRIAYLLREKFGAQLGKHVYSSADGFGSKRTGGIFEHLQGVLHLAGSEILHIGDSLRSDYQMPKASGWNSFYLPLPEIEKRLRRECFSDVQKHFAQYGIPLNKYLHFNL